MNTSALILMVSVQVIVTAFTAYFFWRVLTAAPEPDSFPEDKPKDDKS